MKNKLNKTCPFCDGNGRISDALLDEPSYAFIRDLKKSNEINTFFVWALNKYRSEPDRSVSKIVHTEINNVRKELQDWLKGTIEKRDEKQSEKFEDFMQRVLDQLGIKEEEKEKLESEFRNFLKTHIDENREDHKTMGQQITEILDNVRLTKKVAERGFKFEDIGIEELEQQIPHWEFEPTNSKYGDCVVKPKVVNGNGELEPTKYKILIDFTEQDRIGTTKLRRLKENLKNRNIHFGLIITKTASQLTKKYYPYYIEDRVAVAPIELKLHLVALRMFEGIITTLHSNGKPPDQVDWNKIKMAVNKIMEEESELQKFFGNWCLSQIKYTQTQNTKITNRIKEHCGLVTEKIKTEISSQQK